MYCWFTLNNETGLRFGEVRHTFVCIVELQDKKQGMDSLFWNKKQAASPSVSVRWLCNESLPPTSRRWSVEGLAYLTFDADVKEDFVEDKSALLAMFELAKVGFL